MLSQHLVEKKKYIYKSSKSIIDNTHSKIQFLNKSHTVIGTFRVERRSEK